MTRIAVGFGSNLGDRGAHLEAGLAAISRQARPVALSSLYESAPVGLVEQDSFLNAVVVFETGEEPARVLERLQAAEADRARVRDVRWGPRTLDLDLLLYGRRIVETLTLTIPHPEMTNRRFVLEPLLEAWPEAALPDGTRLDTFLPAVANQQVQQVGRWRVGPLKRLWWWLRRTVSNRS